MDPSFGNSNSTSTGSLQHDRFPPLTDTPQSIPGHDDTWGRTDRETPRRGHSDGDVLTHRLSGRRRTTAEEVSGERQTWIDFIRDSSDDQRDALNPVQLAIGRSALMAADRRKRLAEHQEEHSRRRASASLSSIPQSTCRLRQSSMPTGGEALLTGPPPPFNAANRSTQRLTNRPLPRPPNAEIPRDRRSRDITLPKWQPDADVSKCPICATSFGFWYRKHHCRKCGRVVCGNCSPHRITIPRQFIVHPPDEAASSPTARKSTDAEIIDLTGENDLSDDALHSDERPQSSDYRIDPALGGGQEVRLCNPCVPDPNPLPHLPLSAPRIDPFDPIQRPNQVISQHRRPSIEGLTGGESERSRHPVGRSPSDHPSIRHNRIPSFDGSMASRETFVPPERGTLNSRRHSHAPRPFNPSMPPPGYSSIYGSVPDQAVRQRELATLLQTRAAHRHHRHHASFPTLTQHRPLPGCDTPIQHSTPPRSQLREEDECPICHQALPPKGPDNSEVAREAHIQSCIETHFSSSATRPSDPPPSAPPGAVVTASAASPAQAAGARAIPTSHRWSMDVNDMPSASFQQRRRVAGMLVYHASEKDCVGEDGKGAQECVICFEEFAIGDQMGRLECLCKFHKACIRQWWEKKEPGACPVHQEGT